jgi:hypothetical protein
VWWWVLFTFVFLLVLQTALPLYIIFSEGLAQGFDWMGFIGFSLGLLAVPLVIGCLGLLWRSRRGLGYFLVSLAVFLLLTSANVVGSAAT